MNCTECPYYWKDNDFAYCHRKWNDGQAPCEVEEEEREDEEY